MKINKFQLAERFEHLFDVGLRKIEVERAYVQLHRTATAVRTGTVDKEVN